MNIPEPLNAAYIDEQYRQWRDNPRSVSKDWQLFFAGFQVASDRPAEVDGPPADTGGVEVAKVEALIARYRELGHLLACIDPLSACPTDHPLLNLSAVGLSDADLDTVFPTPSLPDSDSASLREIRERLRETYCRSVGVELMHIQDPDERDWLIHRMEPDRNRPDLDDAERVRILEKLTESALFEGFLNKKYMAQTRFSLEGADALVPMLDALLRHEADRDADEVILGMAHRGRLNIQTNVLKRPFEDIFAQFEHCYDPGSVEGSGDVKYHNGFLTDLEMGDDRTLRVFLVDNPSHLESVDPVVEGVARARQDMLGDTDRKRIVPILLHGDAAFAGQGVVAETLNLSGLDGYRTGGTMHIIINNQIGYTTLPEDARSTRYSTDVAKMLMVPIFHVHGENPEAVVHVVRLAADYRRAFGKDVVIDVICYRRFGHNEGDEPYFTQPDMYTRIKERPPLNRLYGDALREAETVDEKTVKGFEKEINGSLETAFESVRGTACAFPVSETYSVWDGITGRYTHDPVDTGVDQDGLTALARKLNTVPEEFSPHPKLKGLFKKRLEAVESGEGIDWANAEALAFATLLTEGVPVRLSGQDCRRGTFSQRHCVLVDSKTEDRFTPLSNLADDQAPFSVFDSLLAEASVLGFEYGYSAVRPGGLTLWEAQFGDFVNNAQAVIDLYIVSGQSKWSRLSGLTLLLPHGLEGLGPEHSSARPERFLQLCSDDNIQVCNLTTPAQYFHLLRRQVKAPYRKPLVLMAPKSLLRHPQAVSNLSDLTDGGFEPIIDDPDGGEATRRVLICSGKLYYELRQRREELKAGDIALIRMEQIYPFPKAAMEEIARKYNGVEQWCWVQEEPANMGAWDFVWGRLETLIGEPLRYIGRKTGSSPATGYPRIYRREQAAILEEAIGPPADQLKASDRYQAG